jgi:hypothetical protein
MLGSIKSPAKAAAARLNGLKGGRPNTSYKPLTPIPPFPEEGYRGHPVWPQIAANDQGVVIIWQASAREPYWRACAPSRVTSGNRIHWTAKGPLHHLVYECAHQQTYKWSKTAPDGFTLYHINGIKNDNRVANLRLISTANNLPN